MFLGHFAVAMASKRVAPKTSLGSLLIAAQLADLLWPILLLLGLERVRITPGITKSNPLDFVSYPISHSLLLVLTWAAGLALLYRWRTGYARGAIVCGALVVSHWVLDAVVHRPDLPLYPGGRALVGFGLWNSLPGTLVLEGAMFAAGIGIYVRTTRARSMAGSVAFWSLVVFLLLAYAGASFGPPPPNARAIGITALIGWLLAPWAFWIDRNREVLVGSAG